MIARLRSLARDRFLRNSAGITMATAVAQAVAMGNWALMTYVFDKAEIGGYVVLQSYVPILALVCLLSYEMALPNVDQEDATTLIWGACLVLLLFCAAVLGVAMWCGYSLAAAMTTIVMARGLSRMGELLNTRQEAFRLMAAGKVFLPLSVLAILVVFEVRETGTLTMFANWVALVNVAIAAVYFIVSMKVSGGSRIFPGVGKVLGMLRAHAKNPAMLAPASLMNALAYNLPPILTERYFGAPLAAQYGMVIKFCFAPVGLIGSSVMSVFHGRLGKLARGEEGALTREELRKLRKFLALGALVVAVMIGGGYPLFAEYVLDGDWSESVVFSWLLVPLYWIMVYVAPVTVAFVVFNKQVYLLWNQFSYLCISLLSFGCGVAWNDLNLAVGLFSGLSLVRYLFINKKVGEVLSRAWT